MNKTQEESDMENLNSITFAINKKLLASFKSFTIMNNEKSEEIEKILADDLSINFPFNTFRYYYYFHQIAIFLSDYLPVDDIKINNLLTNIQTQSYSMLADNISFIDISKNCASIYEKAKKRKSQLNHNPEQTLSESNQIHITFNSDIESSSNHLKLNPKLVIIINLIF